ncbi:fimbrial protein [Enterobacteriaceae bacterium 4M9]|nr:fimbrial protein [Enterobacteriaceae bacterium 4M9]
MPEIKEGSVNYHQELTSYLLPAALLLATVKPIPVQAVEKGDPTIITVMGILVEAPQCTVNGNNRIDVDFGDDVYIRKIDGVTYKKTALAYSLDCASLADTKLKLAITGTPATFGNGLLNTDKSGLGIRLYHDNTVLPAGDGVAQYVNFTWSGPDSGPALYAVPVVEEGATLTPGDFSGSGTLVVDYQ